jgi:hypothetical protein
MQHKTVGDSELFRVGSLGFPLIRDADQVEHVKVFDLCAPFGLKPGTQTERLKNQAWARPRVIGSRRSDGKLTKFSCIPLESVPMFFATLDASRVNATHRPQLVEMQREVARALADYYLHGGAVRPTAMPSQLLDLRARIDEILRPVPATDPVWPARFTKRYEAWHGRAWQPGDPQPFSMKAANWFFYEMVFPRDVLAVIRARGLEEGVRYHQVLADVPRDYLGRQLDIAAVLADECGSETEWRKRMRRVYGRTKADLLGQGSLSL